MSACPLVVLACERLHVCTVCIWRCEHARFCVEGFYALYINFHSFIHSTIIFSLDFSAKHFFACVNQAKSDMFLAKVKTKAEKGNDSN